MANLKRSRIKKITMTVHCMTRDLKDVQATLDEWFTDNEWPLAVYRRRVSNPKTQKIHDKALSIIEEPY